MRRRTAVSGLSALFGAALMTPAAIAAPKLPVSPPLLIGIGGAGTNLALMLAHRQTIRAQDVLCINTRTDAPNTMEARRSLLVDGTCASALEVPLTAAISDARRILLLVGLGGQAGSSIAPALARQARDAGIPVIALTVMPFAWEGQRRAEVAQVALSRLQIWADEVLLVSNELVAKDLGCTATLNAALQAADEVVIRLAITSAYIA